VKSANLFLSSFFLLTSCYVRLPSVHADHVQEFVGQTYFLRRDIWLVSNGSVPASREVNDDLGPKGRKLDTIPKNTEIRIDSVVKRIDEPGVSYFYVCREVGTGRKFDLDFRMRDSIGLPVSNQ
jgi:hypothetical protein